jgi:hypothetical protein
VCNIDTLIAALQDFQPSIIPEGGSIEYENGLDLSSPPIETLEFPVFVITLEDSINVAIALGGITADNVLIKADEFRLQIRLGDDTDFAPLECADLYLEYGFWRSEVPYTVATLPAGAGLGWRSQVVDALGPTFLAPVVGGGAVICPVFHNGTTWIVG